MMKRQDLVGMLIVALFGLLGLVSLLPGGFVFHPLAMATIFSITAWLIIACLLWLKTSALHNSPTFTQMNSPAWAFLSLGLFSVLYYLLDHATPYLSVLIHHLVLIVAASVCIYIGSQIYVSGLYVSSRLNLAKLAVWVWMMVAVLHMLIGWAQYLQLDLVGAAKLNVLGRIYGNLRQPNHFALMCGVSLAILCGYFISFPKATLLRKLTVWLLGLLFVGATVLSVSRAGMVFVLLLGAWACIELCRGRRQAFWMLAMLSSYWLFSLLFVYLDETDVLPFWGAVKEIATTTASAKIDGPRAKLWEAAWQLILQHPIKGVGFEMFAYASKTETHFFGLTYHIEHAHNQVLHWLAEFGVITGSIILAIFIHGFWKCLSIARSATGRTLLVVLFLPVVHHVVEYPLYSAQLLLPWCVLWGWIYAKAVTPATMDSRSTTDESEPQPTTQNEAVNTKAVIVSSALIVAMTALCVNVTMQAQTADSMFKQTEPLKRAQLAPAAYKAWLFRPYVDYAALHMVEVGLATLQPMSVLADKLAYFNYSISVAKARAHVAAMKGQACILQQEILLIQRTSLEDYKNFIDNNQKSNEKLIQDIGIQSDLLDFKGSAEQLYELCRHSK
jgi:O-antigen ligase